MKYAIKAPGLTRPYVRRSGPLENADSAGFSATLSPDTIYDGMQLATRLTHLENQTWVLVVVPIREEVVTTTRMVEGESEYQ